ncbi:hypothetical protein AKG98_1962 [Moritella sp. JT01]|uniref:hypothetical protein n=1 Tax=Moritella sp. JT01 TaxID=756698 RepID=UPI000792DEAF|nr:hypothetical protein [Moritella sp. JT01]KXO08363.1 hypothetical protein AKG98_1962 [Moritella sp. JT01]
MRKTDEISEQELNELRWQEERKLRDILDAKLLKAPVTYEWRLMVSGHIVIKISGAVMSIFLGGLFIQMGVGDDSLGTIIFGIIFSLMLLGMTRYLFCPDKAIHYKLTPLGIIYTEKDTIPDVAYTIMRGFAWFSAVACLATVVYVGPLAFVGAGGMALLAVKFTGFHAETKHKSVNFIGEYTIKVVPNNGVLSIWSSSDELYASRRFYFEPAKEDELIMELSKHMEIKEIIQVKSMRELDF